MVELNVPAEQTPHLVKSGGPIEQFQQMRILADHIIMVHPLLRRGAIQPPPLGIHLRDQGHQIIDQGPVQRPFDDKVTFAFELARSSGESSKSGFGFFTPTAP